MSVDAGRSVEREEIEKRLGWGEQLGLRTPTDSPEWLGSEPAADQPLRPRASSVEPGGGPARVRVLPERRERPE